MPLRHSVNSCLCGTIDLEQLEVLREYLWMNQVYFLPLYNVAILMSTEPELSWHINLLPAI
jgi:hypothetical protein